MELIIHDLPKETLLNIYTPPTDSKIISEDGSLKTCLGCFNCWIKTPGQCIIADDYQKMGEWIAKSDCVTIISKCQYGGYSSFIKNVLDRSISYIHPYFSKRNGEVHHRNRYKKQIDLKVIFYAYQLSDEEKEIARKLVKANSINLNAKSTILEFLEID